MPNGKDEEEQNHNYTIGFVMQSTYQQFTYLPTVYVHRCISTQQNHEVLHQSVAQLCMSESGKGEAVMYGRRVQ